MILLIHLLTESCLFVLQNAASSNLHAQSTAWENGHWIANNRALATRIPGIRYSYQYYYEIIGILNFFVNKVNKKKKSKTNCYILKTNHLSISITNSVQIFDNNLIIGQTFLTSRPNSRLPEPPFPGNQRANAEKNKLIIIHLLCRYFHQELTLSCKWVHLGATFSVGQRSVAAADPLFLLNTFPSP
jgi:hypothetical protein